MRAVLAIALMAATSLPLAAGSAVAQEQPAAASNGPPAPAARGQPTPGPAQDQTKENQPAAHHARETWEEHFARANVAHDGHLTMEEAKAAYKTIARHFHAIDVDGKGFVTENDVRAWKALQKAARQQARENEDPLRPRKAFHLGSPAQRPLNTDADHPVKLPPPDPMQGVEASPT